MSIETIYLDYNASTPLHAQVRDAMEPYLAEASGNPSASHWAARPAREALTRARAQLAALLGCSPAEVVFSSGGTEANNAALKGIFYAAPEGHLQ